MNKKRPSKLIFTLGEYIVFSFLCSFATILFLIWASGVITENYVANELHANNISLYYWAKNQVAEIDFLVDTCDGIIPIEVKANENKKSRSLNYFMENNKVNYGMRISANNFGFVNNIKSVPLYATFCIKKDKENN